MTGCSTAQVQAGLSDAQTASNILETINTDTGGGVTLFTQALVDKALTSTHNGGDVGIVNATIAEGAAALKVQQAAKAAGISSTTAQTLTTGVLTDSAVIDTGAAAAAGATGAPTTMRKVPTRSYWAAELRPWSGEHNPYDVSLTGKHIKHLWEKPQMVANADDGAPLIY